MREPRTSLEVQAALAWRTATDPSALKVDRNGNKIPKTARAAYGRMQLGEHALYTMRMGDTTKGLNKLATAARGFDGFTQLAMALKGLSTIGRRAIGKDAEANEHAYIRGQLDARDLD